MAYITSEHLTAYDTKIKQYIQTQINNAVSTYKQQIVNLTMTVADLSARLEALKNNNNNTVTVPDVPVTPMLRSLSKGGSLLQSGDDNNETPSLRSIEPQSIVVQEDIQEDYIIYDRIISPNENVQYKNIVVTRDNKSNRIYFSTWKTFDNRSLRDDHEINIIWVNARGEKGESTAVDISTVEDRLTFAWDVPSSATVEAGTITYAIRVVNSNPDPSQQGTLYAWHTLPATIECVQGLMDDGWDSLVPAEETPGWVDYIEGKYKVSILIMDEDDYVPLDPKSDEVLYVVNMNDDTINMYLGAKQITGGGGMGNFVELTTQEYQDLGPEVDPTTLYLLTD